MDGVTLCEYIRVLLAHTSFAAADSQKLRLVLATHFLRTTRGFTSKLGSTPGILLLVDEFFFFFLTDECVSDHSERIRSIQIDKNFITQTFRIYNFIFSRTVSSKFLTVLLKMKLYIRNVLIIKFWSIWIDLILSLCSETHSSVQKKKKFKHFQSWECRIKSFFKNLMNFLSI